MKFIMISYVEAVKKIRKVLQKWHIRYLQIEASPKKIHKSWEGFVKICYQIDDRIGVWLKRSFAKCHLKCTRQRDPLPSTYTIILDKRHFQCYLETFIAKWLSPCTRQNLCIFRVLWPWHSANIQLLPSTFALTRKIFILCWVPRSWHRQRESHGFAKYFAIVALGKTAITVTCPSSCLFCYREPLKSLCWLPNKRH